MNECPICYDTFKEDDIIEILECKHKFHYECIFKVYKNDLDNKKLYRNCPFCRQHGGYLKNSVNCIPIKGIHKNYNLFIEYIKTDNEKYKEFFNEKNCKAIIKKQYQCKNKHKENSLFCGKHSKIL